MKHKNRQLKRLRKILRQEETTILRLQVECARYQAEAKKLRERFDEIGKNMKVLENVGPVKCVEWELNPRPYGHYIVGCSDPDNEMVQEIIATKLAEGLLKEGMVQFIGSEMRDDPLSPPIVGGKLYVIPWHTMPHIPLRIRTTE